MKLTSRLRAAGIHLIFSLVVAALVAALIFFFWYPFPYAYLSGGWRLFLLLMVVDVAIGPACTFIVFDDRKSGRELLVDCTAIISLQVAALVYGVFSVYGARPLYVVFEYSFFRVVHAQDIPENEMPEIPHERQVGIFDQPMSLSLRQFRSPGEKLGDTLDALNGVQLSARPHLWQKYEDGRGAILEAAKPVSLLRSNFPQIGADIDHLEVAAGRSDGQLAYVPVLGRGGIVWSILLDAATAQILGAVPADSLDLSR